MHNFVSHRVIIIIKLTLSKTPLDKKSVSRKTQKFLFTFTTAHDSIKDVFLICVFVLRISLIWIKQSKKTEGGGEK